MPARFVALICLTSWLPALDANAADQFPYITQVVGGDAYVRSGPGKNFYPTDKLPPGEKVEVYRHDPGGWCAIRPPEGSFSWVSARYVKPVGDGLGQVTTDQVVARVGSQLSNVRDVIQVRLNAGERVEILEEYEGSAQNWYKIAAPAGEFRWINATLVSGLATGIARSDATGVDAEGEIMLGGVTPRIIIEEEDEELLGISDGELHAAGYEAATSDNVPSNAAPSAAPAQTPSEPAAEQFDFAAEIAQIELRISQLVAEEPTLWVFDDLAQRVDDLEDISGTAGERQQARRLQQKLKRMAEIHDRFEEVGAVLDASGRPATTNAATHPVGTNQIPPQNAAADLNATGPAAAATPASAATMIDRKFDAEGVLRPVVSRRTDAPRYALVDEAGVVQNFLTPGPGMNLQPHLGARLGVVGTRGYIAELRKPHVMVKRIVVLQPPVE